MAPADSVIDKPRHGKQQTNSLSLLSIWDSKTVTLVVIFSMLFVCIILDAGEISTTLAGAVVYSLLRILPKMAPSKKLQASERPLKSSPPTAPQNLGSTLRRSNCKPTLKYDHCAAAHQPIVQSAATAPGQIIRRKYLYRPSPSVKHSVTVVPITAPVFKDSSFNNQVSELIAQLMPTPDSEKAVAAITRFVKQAIQPVFPEGDVCGFACSSIGGSAAFGVAVPAIEIVLKADPAVIVSRIHELPSMKSGRRGRGSTYTSALQKAALRVCTTLLMEAGFKFRRSCFRSKSPKVTLMVPSSFGICSNSLPCDFSVNTTTPLYNMALFTESGRIELRAKELHVLVQRWTRDRGICHASKGHLPPYAWTLLVIYFLQVGVLDEGALLPPLEDFVVTGVTAKPKRSLHVPKAHGDRADRDSIGDLFKKFVTFYNHDMDWYKEAVNVRLAKRAAPNFDLEMHVVVNEDGSTLVSPIIEDPFNTKHNLGCCTNAMTLRRFYDEFDRANVLMAKDEPLTTLLELWRPPDAEGKAKDKQGAHDEPDE